jgi:nucleolar protein 58
MAKIVVDNLAFAKTVKVMGVRTACGETDLSHVLPEDLDAQLKAAAEVHPTKSRSRWELKSAKKT